MKRLVDILVAAFLLALLWLPMLCIALIIKLTSRGPAIYWSRRIGQNNVPFWMPKFRTMRRDTPQLATHLLPSPEQWLTPIGSWLRKTSLDELPQLWSILKGDMSFVGPRPALFNQHDLIQQRSQHGIDRLLPGLTGWAQINGRDLLSVEEKVILDAHYLQHQSLKLDAWIVLRTIFKIVRCDDVVDGDVQFLSSRQRRVA